MTFEAEMENPLKVFNMKGLNFKDTAYTYLDAHEMPSSGDWGLQRQAAITVEGTENLVIDSCVFSRLDGNAVNLNGYNRHAKITKSECVWNGDNCFAAWGKTTTNDTTINKLAPGFGYDGTTGT